jgi:N-acetylglucosamine kinase-like BadF-type ATPase
MPLYLGIDAGGTKTDCAVSNGAELLGQATGASCKLARVGKERGRENLQSVIRQATQAAGVEASTIQHVCIGMSGASLAEAVQWAQQTIRELIPDSTIYVAGDHVIAHRAAFGTSPGVLVISGTGSIAFGRNQSGETARAGGWGPNVSEQGSRNRGAACVRFWKRQRLAGHHRGMLEGGAGRGDPHGQRLRTKVPRACRAGGERRRAGR